MVRAMYRVQLKDSKTSEDLLLILEMTETIDHLVMENSVHWYDYVLRREDGHVLRWASDVEAEVQRKKQR